MIKRKKKCVMKSDRTADFFKVYKIFIVELLVRFCNCLSCPNKAGKTGRFVCRENYKRRKASKSLDADNLVIFFILL